MGLLDARLPCARPADLTFDANYIFVHGGALSAGSQALPFGNALTITLHGDRYSSTEIPVVGAKCLAAMSTEASAGGSPTPGTAGPAPTNAGALAAATANRYRAFSAGTIDFHGTPRRRVWTMLGADIPAGSSACVLPEASGAMCPCAVRLRSLSAGLSRQSPSTGLPVSSWWSHLRTSTAPTQRRLSCSTSSIRRALL